MSSRTESARLDNNYGDPIIPAFKRRDVPSTQESRRQVAADKLQTCRKQHSDKNIITVYTLVDGVTDLVDGNIILETLPSLNALFNREEVSGGELSQFL